MKLGPLTVTNDERAQVRAVTNSSTLVLRTRMILDSGEGLTVADVAQRIGTSTQTVGNWASAILQSISGSSTPKSTPTDDASDHGLVLSVDEKSQLPAFGRTQPKLLMDLGYFKDCTCDYFRHSPATLFVELDFAPPKVISNCKMRCRPQEFFVLLCLIDEETPSDLESHLELDECVRYRNATVKVCLAKRPRGRLHVTPIYSSRLNQMERWCNQLSGRALCRNTCHSERELVEQSVQVVKHIPSARASLKVCKSASLYEHFGVHSAVLGLRPHCALDGRLRSEN